MHNVLHKKEKRSVISGKVYFYYFVLYVSHACTSTLICLIFITLTIRTGGGQNSVTLYFAFYLLLQNVFRAATQYFTQIVPFSGIYDSH